MDKTEKFSWRVEPQLKSELEAVAREESTTVTEVLRRASMEYLKNRRKKTTPAEDAKEQARHRAAFDKVMCDVESLSPKGPPVPSATNAEVRRVMGEALERKKKQWDAGARSKARRTGAGNT